ncbi:MAG: hypothetical protein ACLUO4_05810 [Christensenellales bacterium]
MGLESTSARMNAIGRSMVMTGKVKTAEETLRQIEDVQAEDIQEILPLLFDRKNWRAAQWENTRRRAAGDYGLKESTKKRFGRFFCWLGSL